jgi:hypothetical protein
VIRASLHVVAHEPLFAPKHLSHGASAAKKAIFDGVCADALDRGDLFDRIVERMSQDQHRLLSLR